MASCSAFVTQHNRDQSVVDMLRWDAFVMGPHEIVDPVVDAEEKSEDLTAWTTGWEHIGRAEAGEPGCCMIDPKLFQREDEDSQKEVMR